MIKLLKFWCAIKIRNILNNDSLFYGIFQSLVIVNSGLVGFSFGGILDLASKNEAQNTSVIKLLIILVISILPFVFNVLLYKSKTNIIPKLYPLSVFEKTVIEYLYDLINFEYLASLVFVFALFMSSKVFDVIHLFSSLEVICCVNIFINIFKLIVERNIRFDWTFIFSCMPFSLLIIYILCASLTLFSAYFALCLLLLIVFSFIILVSLESFKSKPIGNLTYFSNTYINQFVVLIWEKVETRRIIFAHVMGKTIIMFLLLFFVIVEHEILDNFTLLCGLILILPNIIIPVIANIWGSLPNVWLILKNNNLHEESEIQYSIYKHIVFPLLFIDCICTFIWAYYLNISNPEYYFFYFSSSVFLFFLGFYSSAIFPYFHKKYLNSNMGVSISFTYIGTCILLLLPIWNHWFYIAHFTLIVTGVLGYKQIYKWAESRKYINYANLFNS